MIKELTQGKNIFYRGYVIHEDIPTICYTVFDCRPERIELTSVTSAMEAMQWIDWRIELQEKVSNSRDTQLTLLDLLCSARAQVVA
ncbi:MAG: hypothetical protein ACE5Q6_04595 [Dehalococcoidia bacterium]